MRSVKLSRLLWMVLVVPVAGLAGFAAILTIEATHSLTSINRSAVLAHLANAAAHLGAFGSPGEGRATYPFIAEPTSANKSAMDEQRRLTDASFESLTAAAAAAAPLPTTVVSMLQRLDEDRRQLTTIRTLADTRKITRNEIGLSLQDIAHTSANLVGQIGGLIDDIYIARLVLGLQGALETSTGGLQEGGRGAFAFQTASLSPALYRNLLAGIEQQRVFGQQLKIYGPPSVVAALNAFMDGPYGQFIQRLRPLMLDGQFAKLDQADAPAWIEADQARRAMWLEQLGSLEHRLVLETDRLRNEAVMHAYDYVGTSLAVVLLTALLGFRAVGLIRSHFSGLTTTVNHLMEGKSDVVIEGCDRSDEVGALARGLDAFRTNLMSMQVLEKEAAHSREAMEARRRDTIREMAETFEQSIEGIVERVTASAGDLQGTASVMAGSAGSAASIATTVSTAATEAASNVNRVAVAAEQLRVSVREVGEQANASSLLAQSAVEEAADTAMSIGKLRDSASRASAVVTMISSIAAQTNLLALNATIEAARAGEAGRGFAVVAAEVKELSNQTARATSEASDLIARIKDATTQSVSVIELIATRMREISGAAGMIANAVDEQGAATQDIARNVSDAAAATSRVTSSISDAADATRSTGDAARVVLASAGELTQQTRHLSLELRRFLGNLDVA